MASKTLRELTIKLDADVAQLSKKLAKATKKMGGLSKRAKGLKADLIGAFKVGSVFVVGQQIKEMVGEMSMLGKELEGVKQGFQGIDPKILDDMRKATHGTVSDLELMKAAVQAKNFGLPLKEMGTMLEFVHRRARASGESVDFLTKSLVTGLGRKSAMIIDNLGISTSQLNAELKKTPDFTTAVANIMKRDMATAGTYIETAADITERWAAQWQNTKAQVGLFINKGIKLIAPALDAAAKSTTNFFKDSRAYIVDFINGWITLYNETWQFRLLIQQTIAPFKVLWATAVMGFKLMIEEAKRAGKALGFALNPKNWGKGFADGMDALQKESIGRSDKIFKEYGESIADATIGGMLEVYGGQKDLLSKNVFNTEAVTELKKEAEETGKELGKSLSKGIAKGLKEKPITKSIKGGRVEGDPTRDPNDVGADKVEEKMTKAEERMAATKERMKTALEQVNGLIENSIEGMLIGFAQNASSGLAAVTKGLLGQMLQFAKAFGQILIKAGIGGIALKGLLKNPALAIPAGVALIGVATLAQKALASNLNFARGGIVPGSSFSGDNVPINTNSGELILNRAQQSNVAGQLSGGRGGALSVVVSGADLKFILDEANRTDNNSF